MSNKKTIVSSALMPSSVRAAPKPSFGGIATSTRLPTFCPSRPLRNPGSAEVSSRVRLSGLLLVKELSNCLPVRPLTAT
jgi:hypothetical protein